MTASNARQHEVADVCALVGECRAEGDEFENASFSPALLFSSSSPPSPSCAYDGELDILSADAGVDASTLVVEAGVGSIERVGDSSLFAHLFRKPCTDKTIQSTPLEDAGPGAQKHTTSTRESLEKDGRKQVRTVGGSDEDDNVIDFLTDEGDYTESVGTILPASDISYARFWDTDQMSSRPTGGVLQMTSTQKTSIPAALPNMAAIDFQHIASLITNMADQESTSSSDEETSRETLVQCPTKTWAKLLECDLEKEEEYESSNESIEDASTDNQEDKEPEDGAIKDKLQYSNHGSGYSLLPVSDANDATMSSCTGCDVVVNSASSDLAINECDANKWNISGVCITDCGVHENSIYGNGYRDESSSTQKFATALDARRSEFGFQMQLGCESTITGSSLLGRAREHQSDCFPESSEAAVVIGKPSDLEYMTTNKSITDSLIASKALQACNGNTAAVQNKSEMHENGSWAAKEWCFSKIETFLPTVHYSGVESTCATAIVQSRFPKVCSEASTFSACLPHEQQATELTCFSEGQRETSIGTKSEIMAIKQRADTPAEKTVKAKSCHNAIGLRYSPDGSDTGSTNSGSTSADAKRTDFERVHHEGGRSHSSSMQNAQEAIGLNTGGILDFYRHDGKRSRSCLGYNGDRTSSFKRNLALFENMAETKGDKVQPSSPLCCDGQVNEDNAKPRYANRDMHLRCPVRGTTPSTNKKSQRLSAFGQQQQQQQQQHQQKQYQKQPQQQSASCSWLKSIRTNDSESRHSGITTDLQWSLTDTIAMPLAKDRGSNPMPAQKEPSSNEACWHLEGRCSVPASSMEALRNLNNASTTATIAASPAVRQSSGAIFVRPWAPDAHREQPARVQGNDCCEPGSDLTRAMAKSAATANASEERTLGIEECTVGTSRHRQTTGHAHETQAHQESTDQLTFLPVRWGGEPVIQHWPSQHQDTGECVVAARPAAAADAAAAVAVRTSDKSLSASRDDGIAADRKHVARNLLSSVLGRRMSEDPTVGQGTACSGEQSRANVEAHVDRLDRDRSAESCAGRTEARAGIIAPLPVQRQAATAETVTDAAASQLGCDSDAQHRHAQPCRTSAGSDSSSIYRSTGQSANGSDRHQNKLQETSGRSCWPPDGAKQLRPSSAIGSSGLAGIAGQHPGCPSRLDDGSSRAYGGSFALANGADDRAAVGRKFNALGGYRPKGWESDDQLQTQPQPLRDGEAGLRTRLSEFPSNALRLSRRAEDQQAVLSTVRMRAALPDANTEDQPPTGCVRAVQTSLHDTTALAWRSAPAVDHQHELLSQQPREWMRDGSSARRWDQEIRELEDMYERACYELHTGQFSAESARGSPL